jgi:sulfur carrier protein
MRVILNGRPMETTGNITLAGLLEEAGLAQGSYAVAVNMSVVPRSRIAAYVLKEGDQIEAIEAVGGG